MKNILNKFIAYFKENKHLEEVLKGSVIALLGKIIGMISVYLYIYIISNKFGAYELGIFTLSITVLNILSIIPKFGFENAILKVVAELTAFNKSKELPELIFKSAFLTFSIAFLFGFILYFQSKNISTFIFGKSNMEKPLKIIGLILPFFSVLGVFAAFFRGMKKTIPYVLFNSALISILFLLLLVTSFLLNINISLLYLYFATVLIVFCIALMRFIKGLNKLKVETNKTKYSFSKLLNITLPLLFASSFTMLMNWSDIIILGVMRSEEEVGVYIAAFKIATLTSVVLFSFNTIIAPKFAELHANNNKLELQKIVQQTTRLIFATSIPLLIIFCFFPKYILGFLGEEFLSASYVLIILTFGQLINSLCGSVGLLMQMIGKEKVYQKIILLSLILNITLNLILIPVYGAIGAAIASMISLITWNTISTIYVKKTTGISTFITLKTIPLNE